MYIPFIVLHASPIGGKGRIAMASPLVSLHVGPGAVLGAGVPLSLQCRQVLGGVWRAVDAALPRLDTPPVLAAGGDPRPAPPRCTVDSGTRRHRRMRVRQARQAQQAQQARAQRQKGAPRAGSRAPTGRCVWPGTEDFDVRAGQFSWSASFAVVSRCQDGSSSEWARTLAESGVARL